LKLLRLELLLELLLLLHFDLLKTSCNPMAELGEKLLPYQIKPLLAAHTVATAAAASGVLRFTAAAASAVLSAAFAICSQMVRQMMGSVTFRVSLSTAKSEAAGTLLQMATLVREHKLDRDHSSETGTDRRLLFSRLLTRDFSSCIRVALVTTAPLAELQVRS
jgi:hypothetical protein